MSSTDEVLFKLVRDRDAGGLRAFIADVKPRDLDPFDTDGLTPLLLAFTLRPPALDCAQALVEAGADVCAQSDGDVYTGFTVWHFAAQRDSLDAVEFCARFCRKALAIESEEDETPLLVSMSNTFNEPVPRRMIELAPEWVNKCNSRGISPLLQASALARPRLVALLLRHNADTSVQDRTGCTALHHSLHEPIQAIFEGSFNVLPEHEQVAYMSLVCGADPATKNAAGRTALHYSTTALTALFNFVAAHRPLFRSSLPTLPELLLAGKSRALPSSITDKLSSAELDQLCALCTQVAADNARALEEEASKGGCPFINAKKKSQSSTAPPATEAEIAACPFMSRKSKESGIANVPTGTVPGTSPTSSSSSAELSKPVAHGGGGVCPIPFHRQLVDPRWWAVGIAIGVVWWATSRLWRRAK